MNEKPIERLKFYNGQRLEADDLKLEQEYHIRVRRWLNKSLYSAGIAHGLEVLPDLRNKQQVLVGSGMALDNEGREIILLDAQAIKALGNYLFIQYREETRAEEGDQCNPRGNGKGQLAWGGPSRVRAEPILGFSNDFPHESSGKVVLAQVELDSHCNVLHVHNYPRRYIGPASNAMVRQYALEGERHIDKDNPGRIYFHIRGRQPNSVTLYLRAEKFTTLYYSELGSHTHALDIKLQETDGVHRHDIGEHRTGEENSHNHLVASEFIEAYEPDPSTGANIALNILFPGLGAFVSFQRELLHNKVALASQYNYKFSFAGNSIKEGKFPPIISNDNSITDGPFMSGSGSNHSHKYGSDAAKNSAELTLNADANSNHTHQFSTTKAANAGVSNIQARSEADPTQPQPKALRFVDDLKIYVGSINEDGSLQPAQDYTSLILERIRQLQPAMASKWDKLGNGDENGQHVLATNGTGPIDLSMLSKDLSFSEGQYYIDLRVASGGGRVVYNLYVE